MPILKPISGHTGCRNVRRYLEKNGRAIARDFFNLSWDEREMAGYDEAGKEAVEWDREMNRTRASFGNDAPYKGRKARTYKHFVISPDPEDDIDIEALRGLASDWALRFFGDHQIAIVYHDDNANGIPHAHVVVNNTNLKTGNRMQTRNPLELNRALQDMARERGLSGLSNESKAKSGVERLAEKEHGRKMPSKRQDVHMSRAEHEKRCRVQAGARVAGHRDLAGIDTWRAGRLGLQHEGNAEVQGFRRQARVRLHQAGRREELRRNEPRRHEQPRGAESRKERDRA